MKAVDACDGIGVPKWQATLGRPTMETKRFETGDVVFTKGDESQEIYRVVSGSVGLCRVAEGKSLFVGSVGEGDIFGEHSLVCDAPRQVTAYAAEPTDVEIMTEQTFNERILQDPAQIVPYLRGFFESMRTLVDRLAELESAPGAGQVVEEIDASPAMRTSPEGAPSVVHLVAETDLARERSIDDDFPIRKFPFRIGRDCLLPGPNVFSHNDFFIRDQEPLQISRNHCAIERNGASFLVRDRNSTLGTVVNNQRIGKNRENSAAELVPGENVLHMGNQLSPYTYTLTLKPDEAT